MTQESSHSMATKALSFVALGCAGLALISTFSQSPTESSVLVVSEDIRHRRANGIVHVKRAGDTQEKQSADERSRKNVWLTGLMSDASVMTSDTFDFLMDWNCQMGAHVHLMVQSGADHLTERRSNFLGSNPDCLPAAFHVEKEPMGLLDSFPNRVDRIAHLRDVQRHALMELIGADAASVDAIMIMDGDLHSVPNARFVENEMLHMLDGDSVDVLCSTGVNHDSNAFGYYDTFATILKPDTWTYPYEFRQNPEARPEQEDPKLVVDTGLSNVGLLKYIQSAASTPLSSDPSSSKVLPVKSCFGGLAIYRSASWLNAPCMYTHDNQSSISAFLAVKERDYANRDDKRQCEHVTFHECMEAENSNVRIALHPQLVTEYHDVVGIFTDDSRRVLLQDFNVTAFGRNSTTLNAISVCACPFTLELTTDYFGYETSYELLDITKDEVVLKGDGLANASPYSETVCLDNGQYIFYMKDSYGDGIFDGGQYSIGICSDQLGRSGGGSGNRWYVERTAFHVDGDNAYWPPPPKPYKDGQLFARTTSQQCAENMHYGPADEFPADGSYLCVDCVSNHHTKWMQVLYDLDIELVRIEWEFLSGPKSIEARFNRAALEGGEPVKWTITETANPETPITREGIWKWSSSSKGFPTDLYGNRFSRDDGAWGAADIEVNGDGYNNVPAGFWGQGNFNSGDGTCMYFYRNGVKMDLELNALWGQIYAVYESSTMPSPTPPPTDMPTMAPTMTPDCQFELLLQTDKWGGETSWELVPTDGRVMTPMGVPFKTYNREQTYSFTTCLEPGEYKFTIFDFQKDGMWDTAYYKVTVGGQAVKAGGGKGGFLAEESFEISIANDSLF